MNIYLNNFKNYGTELVYTIYEKINGIVEPKNRTQFAAGFILGLGIHKVYAPLTNRIVTAITSELELNANFLLPSEKVVKGTILSNPFTQMSFHRKLLMGPQICILAPILEEVIFRSILQEKLKNDLRLFYANQGLSPKIADITSRVTAIFFGSIIFGLAHFTNALSFQCNPILFLPQVVSATVMGFVFGMAKEFSGDLYLPIGMHMGNNVLAWSSYLMM